jgi:methyl-accepting chemotaxis protein
MRLSDVSITKKLFLAFSVVLATVFAMSVVVFLSARSHSAADQRNQAANDAQAVLERAKADTFNQASLAGGFKMTGDLAVLKKVDLAELEFGKDIADIRKLLSQHDDMLNLLEEMVKAHAAWKSAVDVQISLFKDPARRDEAVALAKSPITGQRMNAFRAATQKTFDAVNAFSDAETARAEAAMRSMEWTLGIGGLVAMILSGAMGWLLSRTVGAPVVALTETMKQLSAGDNSVTIRAIGQKDEIGQMADAVQTFKEAAIEKLRLEQEAVEGRRRADAERAENEAARAEAAAQQALVVESVATGLAQLSDGNLIYRLSDRFAPEYEKLRADFNGAVEKLQNTMKVVTTATSTIRSGAGDISRASDDLARRTEQQAASLEETAAALEQITATVRTTAEGSSHASQSVASAKVDAERSGEIVGEAVTAMNNIEKSSQEISQIIGVIDEIAFQTNLLALNAGVEAARAGDAGRGFAVVASEVRALAQRSASAAKEIKTLISVSGQQVKAGVDLVGETGKALDRIVVQVSEINGIVSNIAASTREQATALNEVNGAVSQMDQVTQQNAAMVEEATAASHGLTQEAEELARLIGAFQVGQKGQVATHPTDRRATGPRSQPVQALKPTGRGGAALKPTMEPQAESWEEF